jgi:hypothetical protein
MRYTPSLGANPCRMVVKTITNVYELYEPVFREERQLYTSNGYTAYHPAISRTSCGNKYAYWVCQTFSLGEILIHTSERKPAASRIKNDIYAPGKGLTIQLLAEKPRMMALAAKITVARCLGRRYTASRYTFSPPERGNMVPNSSQMKSPQNESKNPATQSNRDAPTDPTDPRMVDGVENIPVPIIRPMLDANSIKKKCKTKPEGVHT